MAGKKKKAAKSPSKPNSGKGTVKGKRGKGRKSPARKSAAKDPAPKSKASAQKKKTSPKKSVPKKSAPKKSRAKTGSKKQNYGLKNYNAIRSAVSKYCKENGKTCSNEELNAIYHELEIRYLHGPNPKLLLKVDDIIKDLPAILEKREIAKQHPPAELRVFQWFLVEDLLKRKDKLFFHANDKIILDFSVMNMERYEFPFKDLGDMYRTGEDSIYLTMRARLQELEDMHGKEFNSPQPELDYREELSDPEKRVFYWMLIHDQLAGGGAQEEPAGEEEKGEVEPEKGKKGKKKSEISPERKAELEIEKLREKNKEKELTLKEREQDLELVKLKIMTPEEFRKKWAKTF